MSDPPTQDLAARLARGDDAAFAELYDACADRLHRWLVLRLGSHDAAADVLQSAFLRAVRSRRRFRKVENPEAYLFQIARNEAARSAARQRRRKEETLSAPNMFACGGNAQHDDAEAVAAALEKLDADDRELVELKTYAGLTFREIAEIIGRPQATIATRYRRALALLRSWLTKQL